MSTMAAIFCCQMCTGTIIFSPVNSPQLNYLIYGPSSDSSIRVELWPTVPPLSSLTPAPSLKLDLTGDEGVTTILVVLVLLLSDGQFLARCPLREHLKHVEGFVQFCAKCPGSPQA